MCKSRAVGTFIASFCLIFVCAGPVALASPKSDQHQIPPQNTPRKEGFEKSAFYRGTVGEDQESEVLRKTFNHPLQQWRDDIVTTVFYIGEYRKSRVGLLNNRSSAWIAGWVKSFGGVDHPGRKSIFPTKFTPKENPFYFALPLSDKVLRSVENNEILPQYQEIVIFFNRIYSANSHEKSFLKNTWIAIEKGGKVCYAQWQDVGPYCDNDADYVLRNERPKIGKRPALDVSPAVQKLLNLSQKDVTRWRFVAPSEVPDGPWKKIVSGEDAESGQMASLR